MECRHAHRHQVRPHAQRAARGVERPGSRAAPAPAAREERRRERRKEHHQRIAARLGGGKHRRGHDGGECRGDGSKPRAARFAPEESHRQHCADSRQEARQSHRHLVHAEERRRAPRQQRVQHVVRLREIGAHGRAGSAERVAQERGDFVVPEPVRQERDAHQRRHERGRGKDQRKGA